MTTEAINSGELIQCSVEKSLVLNSSQNQSKLKPKSNATVPSEPNTRYPLFLIF